MNECGVEPECENMMLCKSRKRANTYDSLGEHLDF